MFEAVRMVRLPMPNVSFKYGWEFKNSHLHSDGVWHVFLMLLETPNPPIVVAHECSASSLDHLDCASHSPSRQVERRISARALFLLILFLSLFLIWFLFLFYIYSILPILYSFYIIVYIKFIFIHYFMCYFSFYLIPNVISFFILFC